MVPEGRAFGVRGFWVLGKGVFHGLSFFWLSRPCGVCTEAVTCSSGRRPQSFAITQPRETMSGISNEWEWYTILIRSISPRSVQLSPMGSELGWGLLADQSESRKFLCPDMERLCAALKSAAKIHVQCFAKTYSSILRPCDNQSLQSHLLGSKNDKEKYWILQLFQRRLFTEYRTAKSSAG